MKYRATKLVNPSTTSSDLINIKMKGCIKLPNLTLAMILTELLQSSQQKNVFLFVLKCVVIVLFFLNECLQFYNVYRYKSTLFTDC